MAEYVPDFPRGEEITLRMLATNRSGVPHVNDLPWYDQFEFRDWPLVEIVERLKMEPLDFEPGTDSNYSNGGFALLARILEVATGKAYGEVLREQVFEPAGMRDSGHEGHNALVPMLARGYTYGMAGVEPPPYVEMSLKVGGGSVYSTVGDLYRFARAVGDGTLIAPALADSLFGTIDSPTGHERVYHGGRAPGYTAALVRYPTEDVVVAILSNNYSRLNEEISDGLAGIVFGGTYDNRLGDILARRPFPATRSRFVASGGLRRAVASRLGVRAGPRGGRGIADLSRSRAGDAAPVDPAIRVQLRQPLAVGAHRLRARHGRGDRLGHDDVAGLPG